MSDVPRYVVGTTPTGEDLVLSEQQLFALATGETVTVDVPGSPGRTLSVSVEPPVTMSDRE